MKNSVLVVVLSALISHTAGKRCFRLLSDQSIPDSTEVHLRWSYTCNIPSTEYVTFKVYYYHDRFLACTPAKRDQNKHTGWGNRDTEDRDGLCIQGLNPYSVYNFSVKAIPPEGRPEEYEIQLRTNPDLPDVRPDQSLIDTFATETSLRFFWRDPVMSECERFNGELDGVRFVLKGTDPWNMDERAVEGVTKDKQHTFEGLKPHSNYVLFVYSRNSFTQYNEDVYLKLKAQTKMTQPNVPRNLTATRSNTDPSMAHTVFRAPYPPTGEIDHYELRHRPKGTEFWSRAEQVASNSNLCSDNELMKYIDRAVVICHTVTALDPDKDYEFQVRAKNVDVPEMSAWTAAVSTTEQTDPEDDNYALVVTIVASVVSILFVLLLVVVLTYFCRRRAEKARYRGVPFYDPSYGHAGRPLSTTTTTTNDYNRSSFNSSLSGPTGLRHFPPQVQFPGHHVRPGSIQETPLPEPPKEHIYEELPADRKNGEIQEEGGESDQEFLEPNPKDDGDYLTPRPRRMNSAASLDIDEYLKPTFNQFNQIDSRDLSPPNEAPPPIPMESYNSRESLS